MRKAIVLAVLATLAAGCISPHPPASGVPPASIAVRAAIGDTLRLSPGQIADFGPDRVIIAFQRVESDSRCLRTSSAFTPGTRRSSWRFTHRGSIGRPFGSRPSGQTRRDSES